MNMSKLLFVFGVACLYLSSSGANEANGSGYSFPEDRKKPCNCDTFSPIALITSSAKPIWAPELIVSISEDAELQYINNGESVLGIPVKGWVNCTGGPLYSDSYYLTQVIHRNNVVANQTQAAGTRDGVGTPLVYQLFFFNSAYPDSPAEVRKYPDGILNIYIEVIVEATIGNRKFDKFAPVLKNIRKTNSTYNVSAENSLGWLLETLPNNCYYAYPGSARNVSNFGELTPSQIIIEPTSEKRPRISYSQFSETYLKILNPVGQVLTNLLATFPQGNRPVVQICNSVFVNWRSNGKHKKKTCCQMQKTYS